MNIISESTFEKHKKLMLEKLKSDELSAVSKAIKSYKTMSTDELDKEIDSGEAELNSAKAAAKGKKKGTPEGDAANSAVTVASQKVNYATAIKANKTSKSGASSGEKIGDKEKSEYRKELATIYDLEYSQFVPALAAAVQKDKNIQQFLLTGKSDTSIGDDKVSAAPAKNKPVSDLKATQSQVFFDNSIAFPIKDGKYAQIKNYILNRRDPGMPPIIISGGYVIDGHHRWSQVFCWNKHSVLDAYDIKFPDNDPSTVLKKIQLGIVAVTGKVPTSGGQPGDDLFSMSKETFIGKVKAILNKDLMDQVFNVPEVIEAMNKNAKIPTEAEKRKKEAGEQGNQSSGTAAISTSVPAPAAVSEQEVSNEDRVAEYLWNNVVALQASKGEFPRTIMPQTGEYTDPKVFVSYVKKGNVNFDVKTEGQLFESTFNKFKKLFVG